MEHLQQRERHWAIINLVDKRGYMRTVPIPVWVKEAIDIWCTTGNIKTGNLFRCVNKTGSIWAEESVKRSFGAWFENAPQKQNWTS
jgi:hypothetical protein